MELLVCVINEPGKVDEILQAFLDIGVTGATILDSQGMGTTLVEDVPIFAGFRNFLAGVGKQNKTILSVVKDHETVERAVASLEKICGSFETPSTGIVFTLPVTFVKGLRSESAI
jgi:nitrogen regulatory protein PII